MDDFKKKNKYVLSFSNKFLNDFGLEKESFIS
jgi:hypothetical protein